MELGDCVRLCNDKLYYFCIFNKLMMRLLLMIVYIKVCVSIIRSGEWSSDIE